MKRSLIAVLLVGAAIFGLQAFTTHDEPVQQSGFKNLQILPKDINKAALDTVMKLYTRSLNVKCSFCHAKGDKPGKLDFASDDKKEKQIARGMMRMVIDMNKNYFAPHEKARQNVLSNDTSDARFLLSHVTCFTCHHGNEEPANLPPTMPVVIR